MGFEEYLPDLVRGEAIEDFLYVDSKGLVTTGIGNYLPTAASARALPWKQSDGSDAPPDEVTYNWQLVSGKPKGYRAAWYAQFTTIRLTQDDIQALAETRLETEFLPGIKRLLPDFDDLPSGARRVVVDICYNAGVGGLHGFPSMLKAIEAGDWVTAASESHRAGGTDTRNRWAHDLLLSCAST